MTLRFAAFKLVHITDQSGPIIGPKKSFEETRCLLPTSPSEWRALGIFPECQPCLARFSLFNSERPVLGVTEISRALSLSKTSTLRFLQALEMHGYLDATPTCANIIPASRRRASEASTPAAPVCAALLCRSSDVSSPSTASRPISPVLQNDRMVILASVEAEGRLKYSIPLGAKLPVHSTATGQAALSTLETGEVEAIVRRAGMPARTRKTITTLPR